MPASVRAGSSTGGIGSGILNGSGSFALLGNSVPVEPSPEPEHADALKGRASVTPPASPSPKNFLREIFTGGSPLPLSGHGSPRPPSGEKAQPEDQQRVHRVQSSRRYSGVGDSVLYADQDQEPEGCQPQSPRQPADESHGSHQQRQQLQEVYEGQVQGPVRPERSHSGEEHLCQDAGDEDRGEHGVEDPGQPDRYG